MANENKAALPGLKEKRYQQKRSIIRDLYRSGGLSKPEICRLTNMTAPTISRIIGELQDEGWVIDLGQGASIGGKRPHLFSLNPDAAYVLGVDLGREHLKIAVFNLHKEIIGGISTYPSLLETEKDNGKIVRDLGERIASTLSDLQIPREKIRVAGISLPGLLDNEGNSFTYLVYEDTNIRKVLEEMLGIPVFLDNDSSVMAMAEHSFGAARGASDALCVSVSECIGLGMILNARPYGGFRGMAGEFGHIRVPGAEGLCYCGKTGCLETVASTRAVVRSAQAAIDAGRETAIGRRGAAPVTFPDVVRAAGGGDILAIGLLQQAGERIGEALATLIHLFNPELIVIGGEITGVRETVIPAIRQAIDRYTINRLKSQCEIRTSTLTGHACLLGTLSLVMEHLYHDTDSSFSLY